MTPPFPFAGPVPRDAVDPVSILPSSGPATSARADSPSLGAGAFSWPCDAGFMRALVLSGKTRPEIAVMFGRTRHMIEWFCQKHAIYPDPPTPQPCEFCGDIIPYRTCYGISRYKTLRACAKEICKFNLVKIKNDERYVCNRRPPKDPEERVARAFKYCRFTDSEKAAADEGSRYMPRRPDPYSYMGCAAQMCATARVR